MDRHDVEPVIEVGAKTPVGDHRAQVMVGGGDDAHVHLLQLQATDRNEAALLDHLEQLDLQRQRQITDLIEKNRALVRQLQQTALALTAGAGERARHIAEQLGLDQVLRQRTAVQRQKRLRRARAALVDVLSDQGLADAGFPLQQHLHVAGRDLPCLHEDSPRSGLVGDRGGIEQIVTLPGMQLGRAAA